MESASTLRPSIVLKRDGKTKQLFDYAKIHRAVHSAWETLEEVDESLLGKIIAYVSKSLPSGEVAEVEEIQDAIEVALMKFGKLKVAKAFIIFRQSRSKARELRSPPDQLAISNYIHASKYARHIPELGRRESFDETVSRVEDMHIRRFIHIPGMESMIRRAFDMVRQKKVLPSMRSMQFSGPAVESNNNRIYNCAASPVDRPRVFAEAMFLLLSGCGTGYSVQFEHVEKLPEVRFSDDGNVVHHVIEDSIEGWSDALDALVSSYSMAVATLNFRSA